MHVTEEGSVGQAMDLVAVAQQTGEVSAEAYTRLASGGGLKPPKMEGMDALLGQDGASTSNPFLDGSGGPSIQIPSPVGPPAASACLGPSPSCLAL